MSIVNTIGRCGAALQKARRDARSIRMLNNLPPEVQKDIGWPAQNHSRQRSMISILMSPLR